MHAFSTIRFRPHATGRALTAAALLVLVGLAASACSGPSANASAAYGGARYRLPNPNDVATYVAGPDNGTY